MQQAGIGEFSYPKNTPPEQGRILLSFLGPFLTLAAISAGA